MSSRVVSEVARASESMKSSGRILFTGVDQVRGSLVPRIGCLSAMSLPMLAAVMDFEVEAMSKIESGLAGVSGFNVA